MPYYEGDLDPEEYSPIWRWYGELSLSDYLKYKTKPFTVKDGSTFNIESNSSEPTSDLKCAICGGTVFNVAVRQDYTALRCIKCQWEECVHSG